MQSGLFYLKSLDQSISSLRDVWSVFIIAIFIGKPVINANSVDPDQTLHSAASDLGLHCLPMSRLWDARHKWVKCKILAFVRVSFYLSKKKTPLTIDIWFFQSSSDVT